MSNDELFGQAMITDDNFDKCASVFLTDHKMIALSQYIKANANKSFPRTTTQPQTCLEKENLSDIKCWKCSFSVFNPMFWTMSLSRILAFA